jgi:hypothetical protein
VVAGSFVVTCGSFCCSMQVILVVACGIIVVACGIIIVACGIILLQHVASFSWSMRGIFRCRMQDLFSM